MEITTRKEENEALILMRFSYVGKAIQGDKTVRGVSMINFMEARDQATGYVIKRWWYGWGETSLIDPLFLTRFREVDELYNTTYGNHNE